jgi:hypothetical protein
MRAKRRNTLKNAPSTTRTRTLQTNGEDQSRIASWVAHHLENDIVRNEPANAHNSSTSLPRAQKQLSQTINYPQMPERQVLTALNLSKLENEFRDMCCKLSNASFQLLDGVGEVGEETMPLDPHPLLATLELHVRCWGEEWPEVCATLKRSKLFSVPDVAMSLSSAYLFNKVLGRLVQKMQVSLEAEGDLASGSIEDGKTWALSNTMPYD